jgi:MFS family permease
MYCYAHPQRETLLRCNRCERPMCQSCAVLTPTGYRCKECVRGQQKIFDTARWWDYPLTVLVAAVLAYLGSVIAGMFGFFTIFLAPVAGMIISEAVRFVVRKRRSRRLPLIAAGSALLGALFIPLFTIIFNWRAFGVGVNLLSLLWPAVYAILAASTVYYRLKGIRI